MLTSPQPLKNIFFCPEESNFYSHCIETLVLHNCSNSESIIEFGSGDGSPVIQSLLRTNFNGIVYGFELNDSAFQEANLKIQAYELGDKYKMFNRCFFNANKPSVKYLISNPPYLPALDNKLLQPLLHGGLDGITITQQLLTLNYENVLVMVSSYSNPIGLLDFAIAAGYSVADFIVSPLRFGRYSSEQKVKNRIQELQEDNQAFCSQNIYFLAGVLFTKQRSCKVDLSTEFAQVMTCL